MRVLDAFADWWYGRRRGWMITVVAAYAGLAVAYTFPLVLVLGSHVPFKPAGDQLYQLSLLEWERLAFFGHPQDFFAGNFYYGAGGALFASDLLLGVLPVYAPLAWATGNPLFAFNLTYVLAYALNALAMYVAARAMLGSAAGAFVAGAVYAFGALQVNFADHVQLLAAWWLPLALYAAQRFRASYRWRDFGVAVLLVWIQFVTAVQWGIMAALVVLAYAGLPAGWRVLRRRDWRLALQLAAATVAASLPFVPIVRGYLDYADAWRAGRDITELQFWSAQIDDFLSPSERLRWFDALAERFPVPRGERRVFPGFMPVALAALGACAGVVGVRATGRSLRFPVLLALSLGATGVLFALGTHWKWNEQITAVALPYRALYEHVPVFQAIRVVARYALLGNVALALLSGVAALAIGRGRRGEALVAGVLAGLVLVETVPRPISVYAQPERPQLESALQAAPPGPALFVPVTGSEEVARMWAVTRAGAGPIVNGYSGHIWQQYWYFRDRTEKFSVAETPALAAALRAYGIRQVVLYETVITDSERRAWDAFKRGAFVEAIRPAGDHTIITLRAPAPLANRSWRAAQPRVLAAGVPAGHGFVATLVLTNPAAEPWLPPGPPAGGGPPASRVRDIQVKWIQAGGQVALAFATPVLPPPFLAAGDSYATTMHLFTPEEPGEYRLIARADGETITDQPVRVGTPPAHPFKGTGEGLAATFDLKSPAALRAHPGERLPLHVDALNTGTVGWTDRANIRLGFRWYRHEIGGEEEVPRYEGRVPLLGHLYGDIPPGIGYAFAGDLRAPDEPGEYLVRVSMLSELIAWFAVDPIELRVRVEAWPAADPA